MNENVTEIVKFSQQLLKITLKSFENFIKYSRILQKEQKLWEMQKKIIAF